MRRWLGRIGLALAILLVVQAVTAQELRPGGTFSQLLIGTSTPTAITNIRVYSQSMTPAATGAAVGTTAQTFTVTGLTTADKVYVNAPGITSLCPIVHARVSAADTLQLWFSTLTSAACTPASGTYAVIAIRS